MRPFRALPLVLVLLLPVSAQEEEVGRPYWISTPPGAAAALKATTGAIATGDWPAAARSLQAIFDRYPHAFAARTRGRYVGARERALQVLATAPQDLRDAYEDLYGGPAEERLRQALATDDPALLYEVVQRFEAARAGFDAMIALADRALLAGHPAEARLLLARLRAAHPEASEDPAVLARAARVAGRDHAEDGPPPGEWERRVEVGPAPRLPRETWPMIGGNPRRNRIAPPLLAREGRAPRLFEEPRYAVKIDIKERDYDQPPRPNTGFGVGRTRTYRGHWDERWREYNPIHPVIARGHAVYHNGRRLTAINLYTGERQWRVPENLDVKSGARTNLSQLFNPVVRDGVVYAALEVPVPYTAQRLQHVPITYYIPGRRLFAVDLETGERLWTHEDAALEGQPDAEILSKLSITGAPLVRGDRVYAAATRSEGTFHSYLIAVDRHTGRLVYATRLNNGQQELNLFGRQLQECVSSPVTEADGVLYVGTNLGVVAAVDALLGTPLWATGYPIEPIPSTFLWFEAPRRWAHFDSGPPIVAGDLLVYAPADGQYVIAFSRRDGSIAWTAHYSASRTPGRLRYAPRRIHGVDGERVYLGCDGGVAALWLRDDPAQDRRAGGLAWQQEIPQDDAGTGLGILAEDGLYVPTYAGVYRLDAESGKLLRIYPRRGGPDEDEHVHLVWGDGVLLAAGRTFLVGRFDEPDVLELAKAGIEEDPAGVGPRLAAGDVHLATGRYSQAVLHFREAVERARAQGVPAAEARARDGLHRALLARAKHSLRQEPERAPAEFEQAFKAAPTPRALLRARLGLERALAERDHAEDGEWRLRNLRELAETHGGEPLDESGRTVRGWALRRMAALLVDRGQTKKALDELQRLIEADPAGPEGQRASDELARILEREGRHYYEPYERRAKRLFQATLAAGDLQALERGLLIYANTRAAADASLELARRLLDQNEPAAAARNLQRFLSDRRESARTPEALLLMFRALHERRSYGPAFATLLRLQKRYGDELLPRADGARVPARTIVAEWLAKEPYPRLARSAERRDLEPPLVPRFQRTFDTEDFVDVPDLEGQRPPGLEDAVFLRVGAEAVAIDSRSGATIYRVLFGNSTPQGPLVLAGGRLLAVTENRILVFDAGNGKLVASHPVPSGGRGIRALEHHGQVFVLYRERGQLLRAGVAALHPVDGNEIWNRIVPTSRPEERIEASFTLAQDDRLLLFSDHPTRMTVLDATSGAVENAVPLGGEGMLAEAPIPLPDGRVLVSLRVQAHVPRTGWESSYEVLMVDPSRAAERAVLWRYAPPPDGERRRLQMLHVIGQHAVALDEGRGAVCLDLRDGSVAERRDQLPLDDREGAEPFLNAVQPRHDSLLLVLSRRYEGLPPRLHAFEVPSLQRKYDVDLSREGGEQVSVIQSEGVLAISLVAHGGRQARLRVKLLDPMDARDLQEPIEPPAGESGWFTTKVQNGLLIVTTSANVAYAFGPK